MRVAGRRLSARSDTSEIDAWVSQFAGDRRAAGSSASGSRARTGSGRSVALLSASVNGLKPDFFGIMGLHSLLRAADIGGALRAMERERKANHFAGGLAGASIETRLAQDRERAVNETRP